MLVPLKHYMMPKAYSLGITLYDHCGYNESIELLNIVTDYLEETLPKGATYYREAVCRLVYAQYFIEAYQNCLLSLDKYLSNLDSAEIDCQSDCHRNMMIMGIQATVNTREISKLIQYYTVFLKEKFSEMYSDVLIVLNYLDSHLVGFYIGLIFVVVALGAEMISEPVFSNACVLTIKITLHALIFISYSYLFFSLCSFMICLLLTLIEIKLVMIVDFICGSGTFKFIWYQVCWYTHILFLSLFCFSVVSCIPIMLHPRM